uniref:Uncharacterized protein n=1 Tax=uncultured Actinomycetes bacterium TaxID=152507 RepID=A0A871XZD2_9ACTN|nr:hypothetical protein HULAa32G3_00035 [uncultured Actinomycetes bacterium]
MQGSPPKPKPRNTQLAISYEELFSFFRNSVPGYSAGYHETTTRVVEPIPIKIVIAMIKTINHRWVNQAVKQNGKSNADFYSDEMLGYSLSEHVSMFAEHYSKVGGGNEKVVMKEFLQYLHLNIYFTALGDITKRIEDAISSLAYHSQDCRDLLNQSIEDVWQHCNLCKIENFLENHAFMNERLVRIEDWLIEKK